MDKATIVPYADNIPLEGKGAPPKAECVEDLIIYLVTLRHRMGNVPVKYEVRWGIAALYGINLKVDFTKR